MKGCKRKTSLPEFFFFPRYRQQFHWEFLKKPSQFHEWNTINQSVQKLACDPVKKELRRLQKTVSFSKTHKDRTYSTEGFQLFSGSLKRLCSKISKNQSEKLFFKMLEKTKRYGTHNGELHLLDFAGIIIGKFKSSE